MITDGIGAICVSRPTNPSSNVLTDSEIEKLSDIAGANDIPLIVDNAYGAPFPNILFEDVRPDWNENMIFKELDGIDFQVHKPEGAFFLWLWFPDLTITCAELYERLKRRCVLVIPGHYFFPGLKEQWRHKNECIRVNYSQDAATVSAGIKIIAEEIKRAYDA